MGVTSQGTHPAFRDFTVTERPEPGYLALLRSGELARRVERGLAELADCMVCPRDCHTDRLHAVATGGQKGDPIVPVPLAGRGAKRVVPGHIEKGTSCFTGRYARLASAYPHFGEEDVLRGSRGSGTLFFSFCNLRCVFCQNWDISQAGGGVEMGAEELAGRMLDLQAQGCHNINFVTPEHVVPQVLEAVLHAAERGLTLPLVYNTSAYDSLGSLALLDGVIDIYMPDFKTWDEGRARRTLKAADYPQVARRVIAEMHRQVGPLMVDQSGLAVRGLLVRHLVMPGAVDDARRVFRWLAGALSPDTYVNVMGQYYPAGDVRPEKTPDLCGRPQDDELRGARDAAREEGLWRLD